MALIDSEALIADFMKGSIYPLFVRMRIENAPAVDDVPVARCNECLLEGNCFAESHFRFAGIENPFCCDGKRKEGVDID